MRLVKDDGHGNLNLEEYDDSRIPQYAILSHTWGADGDEVTFRDFIDGTGKSKPGYDKIEFCRKQAASDNLNHFWIDTCCIDKSNLTELSKSINSMFHWYHKAKKCYVRLSDVSVRGSIDLESPGATWEVAFQGSRWFRRGWTLQELIAPATVEFFSSEGERIGTKKTLEREIHKITGIPVEALRGASLSTFTVEERMSWAKHRESKEPEDKAYSLLGLFDIFMPLIYAEGEEKALERLRRKIKKSLTPLGDTLDSPPLPSSNVPFRRDVNFVNRRASNGDGTFLEQVEQRMEAPGGRAAIVGIGGVGKSQLAIEYCHRTRDRLPDTWVFWIHASNIDRIKQGYREIAGRAKIPGHKDPKQNVFELVAKWLRDERNGKWLLIMDNLDDDTILSAPRATKPKTLAGVHDDDELRQSLSAYLPQSQNGKILITTRSRSVATKLVELRDILPISVMDDVNAIELLQKNLTAKRDESDMKQLVKILEHMPLAIVQAAAFIEEKGSRYTVQQYIKAFQRSEKQKTSLLNYEAGHLRRDSEAQNSVIVTWQISFSEIKEKWPLSADLLSLMSYFDRQGIPEEVLRAQVQEDEEDFSSIQQKWNGVRDCRGKEDDDTESRTSSDDAFEESMDRLRSYSFVCFGEDRRTFEMHGLVQLAMQKWLETNGQDENWKAEFCMKLNAVLPIGGYHNWSMHERLFPHVKKAERQQPTGHQSVRAWARILQKSAWYTMEKGNYREAERMCEKSVEVLKNVYGADHIETSWSMAELAVAYMSLGRWVEAAEIQVQVFATMQRTLTEEHPNTLTTMFNLAENYRNLGFLKKAEEIHLRVFEIRKRVFGEEHPHTVASMFIIAVTCYALDQFRESKELLEQVAEIRRILLGEEHPDTLVTAFYLAQTSLDLGRLDEAEEIILRVLEARRRVLGEEHPDTISSMSQLAGLYKEQGMMVKAEELELRVLKTQQRVLGKRHPNTLIGMNNAALIIAARGRLEEATDLLVECVQLSKDVFGPEHPKTLSFALALAQMRKQARPSTG